MYSSMNVHTVFPIQTVKLCTRFLCAIVKTSPVVLFLSELSSVKYFWEMCPILLGQVCLGEKKRRSKARSSGLGMGMSDT